MRSKMLWLVGVAFLALLLGTAGEASAQGEVPEDETGRPRLERAYGIVDAVDAERIRLSAPAGPLTVLVDANTVIRTRDDEAGGLQALETGELAAALGWFENDSLLHAFVVVEAAADRSFPLVGELLSVDADGFQVGLRHGTAHVTVKAGTEYRVPGVDEPGLADLEIGEPVSVRGRLGDDGGMTACVVTMKPERRPIHWLVGRATAVQDRWLTIRTPLRRVRVHTNEGTRIRVPGVDGATLSDIEPGSLVAVRGAQRTPNVVAAQSVAVLPEGVARLE
jgi:hypothetical protein